MPARGLKILYPFSLGVPIPQNGVHQTGGTRVYQPLCGGEGERCTPMHHPPIGHAYPPKRSAPDQGDSGVSAAVWGPGGSGVSPCMTVPLGLPIPHNGLPHTRGTRVYLPLCGDWGKRCTPLHQPPAGRPYPPKRSAKDGGDLGVSAALWGRGGGGGCTSLHHPPTGRPYPPRHSAPCRGNSGVSAAVWGQGGAVYPPAPHSH